MAKRAVIYVRTSSEHQGEKSSPDEQEADCRKAAEERGFLVVGVYRDTERYRSKGRLVDPSGTRTDRPRMMEMMRDGSNGGFDVILAWREDRIYRGMRAMLNFLEFIQHYKIDVVLARENFDVKMAPVKAWVAGIELDGMRERMSMGVKARLRSGKANTGQDRYGYVRNGEVIEIEPSEAIWVTRIFDWYIAGTPFREIRRRLIEANAPQKGSTRPRKIHWAKSSIQGILKGAKSYAFGIKVQTRNGEAFNILCPPLISETTYHRFCEVRDKNRTYPARHQKHPNLCGGLLYCTCNRKWSVRVNSYTRKNRKGDKVNRRSLYPTYFCPETHEELISADCPRTLGGVSTDVFVWSQVCKAIQHPEILMAGARASIDEITEQASSTTIDAERLHTELNNVATERQWVITQARKGNISEDDMSQQIASLTMHENAIREDLAKMDRVVDLSMLEGWENKVTQYLQDLADGLESLNVELATPEEWHEQLRARRKIVRDMVERINVATDRSLKIVFKLNLLNLITQAALSSQPPLSRGEQGRPTEPAQQQQSQPQICETNMAETCSHKPKYRARRRRLRAAPASPSPPSCQFWPRPHPHPSVGLSPAGLHPAAPAPPDMARTSRIPLAVRESS
jgi:DNA invertase Pin-like site-specific DNA recombinase